METKTISIQDCFEHDLVPNVVPRGRRENFSFCEKILQDSLHKRSYTTIEQAQLRADVALLI
jgi:hypothetical protein